MVVPCDERATCPGEHPALAWRQLGPAPVKSPTRPHKRDKAVTDNGWMDGSVVVH